MVAHGGVMRRPPVIGITGGIGAGKSAVADALRSLGCVVSDSDAHARAVFAQPDVQQAMRERWGCRACVAGDASNPVDRGAVGHIVFSDPAERVWLESLIHPSIHALREAEFAAAPAGTPALAIDAPLLLESGLGSACDAIVFVDAPDALRLDRVSRNRGWSEADWRRRESAQWPLDRKREAADHVVRNDGDPESLRAQVRLVLDHVIAAGRAG
jgi:dephospho-CoA kinase